MENFNVDATVLETYLFIGNTTRLKLHHVFTSSNFNPILCENYATNDIGNNARVSVFDPHIDAPLMKIIH